MKTNISETNENNKIKAQFTIDLREHVKSYTQNDVKTINKSFQKLQADVGQCHFTIVDMINKATENQLPYTVEIINRSPAYYYIKKSFAELLKKTIDSKLSQLTKPLATLSAPLIF